jgi:5-(carboxyamino)imidazole ribonucleotide mutase
MHRIAIIMGSQSDWATMHHSAGILDDLDIKYETKIMLKKMVLV